MKRRMVKKGDSKKTITLDIDAWKLLAKAKIEYAFSSYSEVLKKLLSCCLERISCGKCVAGKNNNKKQ
jgi:hypothetical protein